MISGENEIIINNKTSNNRIMVPESFLKITSLLNQSFIYIVIKDNRELNPMMIPNLSNQ